MPYNPIPCQTEIPQGLPAVSPSFFYLYIEVVRKLKFPDNSIDKYTAKAEKEKAKLRPARGA
jgi:hypothetical protein